MSKKKRLIIVVDMLNGFCKKGPLASPKFMKTIVPNIKRLLDAERKKIGPIIFVRDLHEKNDPEFKLFPPHCIRGTDEANIIGELNYNRTDLLYAWTETDYFKRTYSPFDRVNKTLRLNNSRTFGGFIDFICALARNSYYTDEPRHLYSTDKLIGLIRAIVRGPRPTVIIVGVCTDICVHYTAVGLIERGYKVIIPADCVDTYDAPGHQAAQVNEFFLKSHFPKILGIKVVDKVEEIL